MVKIRLTRIGKKNNPFYRIVAINSQRKREGKSLAVLGYWHPQKNRIKIDKKSIDDFVRKGAQISEAVKKLFI